jgi:hypothetical protein
MTQLDLIQLFFVFIFPIPLSALLLMAASNMTVLKDKSYKTAIKVLTGSSIISFFIVIVLFGFKALMVNITIPENVLAIVVLIVLLLVLVIPMYLLMKKFYVIKGKKLFSTLAIWLAFHLLLMFVVVAPIWGVVSFVYENKAGL